MAGSDDEQGPQKPTEQRGGTVPDETEAREKGPWAGGVEGGVVPADLGGSDAPPEMLAEDSDLDNSVLGRTTGSDEPATEDGIDPGAGDDADATTDSGPDVPRDAEPDMRDAATGARQSDIDSAR